MQPLVSVLISVYREPIEWVKEAIGSILHQTFTDYEIIIVNDGALDDVQSYLKYLNDSNGKIALIDNKNNLGLTRSLNRGLKVCRGKYIARMDADDICRRDRLSTEVTFMEKNDDYAVVGSYALTFGNGIKDEKNRILGVQCGKTSDEMMSKMLFCNAGPIHSTALIRKSFLDSHQLTYDESIRKSQDYCLWVEILKNGGKIKILHDILVKYRIHANQISRLYSGEQSEFFYRVQERQLEGLTNGYDITSEDKKYHKCLSFTAKSLDLSKVTNYAKKLIKYNRSSHVYPDRLFELEVKKRILKVAIRSRNIWHVLRMKGVISFELIRSMIVDMFEASSIFMDSKVRKAKRIGL